MDVQKKIEQLQSELDRVKRELKESEFKAGEWLYGESPSDKWVIKFTKEENGRYENSDSCTINDGWCNKGFAYISGLRNVRRATEEEIEIAKSYLECGRDKFFDCDMEDHGFMVEIDGHTYSTFMIDDMIQLLGAVPDKTAREIIDEFNRLEI